MGEWRVVYRAANRLEAELVSGWLKSEDIPVIVRAEAAGTVYGFSTGALAEVELLVPEERYEAARALLKAALSDLPDLDSPAGE
ncbi:MAG: DUF2007 domain-containing protein [Clostridia bacterium]|jgi:hypothetical protein|nr:DUF2007 domain-containing protein [Clostridia bacterium]MDH7573276.1 DUF2007 domain-containing protein [Clostridia bacterium]